MRTLDIDNTAGARRLTIRFHGMDELVMFLPIVYDFALGCNGELRMSSPGKDYPGIFCIIEQGNRSAASSVHSTLIDMLHHEKLPLHYYRLVHEWETLRTATWYAQRQVAQPVIQYQD
jgi:hypothetical protein